tara:strand:- start:622 stop:1002 length:381 start_codon:yes stop_codon:yes gene_type:complete
MTAIPKPTRRKKQRRQSAVVRAKLRAVHRKTIWNLDGRRCRCCRRPVHLTTDRWWVLANIHEEPPKSIGGDSLNPEGTICLCPGCHSKVTSHEYRIRFLDLQRGTRGAVLFVDRSGVVVAKTRQAA